MNIEPAKIAVATKDAPQAREEFGQSAIVITLKDRLHAKRYVFRHPSFTYWEPAEKTTAAK